MGTQTAFKPSKNQRYAMRSAQNAYAIAKAFNDLNNQIDLEARQEELNAFNYPVSDEWKAKNRERGGIEGDFIKDPKIDYLMNDKFCDEYYHAVYNRRIAKGWKCNFKFNDGTPEYHVTADAESRRLLELAEGVLIECILDTVPASIAKDLEKAKEYPHRQKLINIAMKWDTNK